jgi:nucleoside-diphosphate-sugar epimerase
MKILVTGASGFLGRRVVSHLSRKGHTPLCLDIVPPEGVGTSFIRCNLTDRQDLSDCLHDRSFDTVIHLAGLRSSGSEMNDVNVDGTSILLEVLDDRAGRVVISSSCAVYGRPSSPDGYVREDNELHPVTAYGRSMLKREKAAIKICSRNGIPVTAVRLFNLFGPGQQPVMLVAEVAHRLARQVLGKEDPPLLTGSLNTSRDLIDAEDAAEAVVRIIEFDTPDALNVGTGIARSGREVVEALMNAFRINIPIREVRRSDPGIERIAADTSLIRSITGWKPMTPFLVTIEAIAGYWLESR